MHDYTFQYVSSRYSLTAVAISPHAKSHAHLIHQTNVFPTENTVSNGSIGSNGHFRLAISMAYYLHDVRMLVITSFKNMSIDELKK
jgi:hypothetical protein